jgi:hypothetical protein
MKKRFFRGIPAAVHAAVAFAVFFGLLGSPVSKNIFNLGGLRAIAAKIQAIFYDDSRESKWGNVIRKRGCQVCEPGSDGVPDPLPPPPPPLLNN